MKESKGTRESRKTGNALLKSLSLVYRNEAKQNELRGKQGPGCRVDYVLEKELVKEMEDGTRDREGEYFRI